MPGLRRNLLITVLLMTVLPATCLAAETIPHRLFPIELFGTDGRTGEEVYEKYLP